MTRLMNKRPASTFTPLLLLSWICYCSILFSITHDINANAFSNQNGVTFLQRQTQSIIRSSSLSSTSIPTEAITQPQRDQNTPKTATRALFLSSFTDGVQKSPKAKSFLHYALLSSLVAKLTTQKEQQLEQSVLASPCNGPNVDILNELEEVDQILEKTEGTKVDYPSLTKDIWSKLLSLKKEEPIQIKILYIPTAMYALRADSNNTPGKQRQRARADGKKRRNVIIRTVQDLFDQDGDDVEVQVLAVTLDLDDGSVKQPVGSDDASLFPKDGKEAFKSWSPNLIYVEGGNTFWLQHCITKGDWSNDIIEACTGFDATVYCGKSAGAIAAGALVETATWKGWDDPSIIPGMETYQDWKNVKGLCFAGENTSFFPHMSEEWNELSKEKIKELGEGNNNHDDESDIVYCLEEGDAFCVDQAHNAVFLIHEET